MKQANLHELRQRIPQLSILVSLVHKVVGLERGLNGSWLESYSPGPFFFVPPAILLRTDRSSSH